MRDIYKEAFYKQAILSGFTQTMAAHPDALQASSLGAELRRITGPIDKLKATKDALTKSNLAIAGLIGLFAGLALLGGKRETRYIMEGGSRDFTRGSN